MKEGSPELRRFISRFRKAYSLISLNCTSTTREVLRKLGNKDPHLAWKALREDALSKEASNKLVFMDKLLDIKMDEDETVRDYEVKFNFITNQLNAMEVSLDPDLVLAIFLHGLPADFKIVVTSIRHSPRVSLTEAVNMLVVEEKELKKNSPNNFEGGTAMVVTCGTCGKDHTDDDCWIKHPEKRPRCSKCGGRNHWDRNCRSGKPKQCAYVMTNDEPFVL